MNTLFYLRIPRLRAVMAAVLLCMVWPLMAQKQLTILHTSDTHSCIMPLSEQLADTLWAGRGGFVRRLSMLQQERKADKDLLLFDSGDFSQGSPYYTLFKGEVEIGLMNRMHYDAATIGNHEFDFGINNMVRIFKMAHFPILCSNYDFTGTPLDGVVKPYTIIKRKGLKIGVFALDPPLEGLVVAKNYLPIKYLNPVRVANDMVKLLKGREKCDLVICISHLGWLREGDGDPQVFAQTRGVDLVLGGHSHSFFTTLRYVKDLDGHEVPVDHDGKNAIFVGKMQLYFKPIR